MEASVRLLRLRLSYRPLRLVWTRIFFGSSGWLTVAAAPSTCTSLSGCEGGSASAGKAVPAGGSTGATGATGATGRVGALMSVRITSAIDTLSVAVLSVIGDEGSGCVAGVVSEVAARFQIVYCCRTRFTCFILRFRKQRQSVMLRTVSAVETRDMTNTTSDISVLDCDCG